MWLGLCPQIIDWQAQIKMRDMSDENDLVCSSKFDKGVFGNGPFPHKRELPACCVLGYLYCVLEGGTYLCSLLLCFTTLINGERIVKQIDI